jgi:hypothetical protein
MTTGRINQVTIVRRGWPTDACEDAGEISKLLITPGGAPSEALLARPAAPRRAIQFSPLTSPGHLPPHSQRGATWEPQEEDLRMAGNRHAQLPPAARL